ncbi:MAG TPA: hypothetical protein DCE12_04865 [Gammaproteobacteria bacterium]|nr:hypothetical protein [Gammaproteobacteria bacterium]HAF74077.1 hypothetical protein [Gammaproteobacteria bacterium]
MKQYRDSVGHTFLYWLAIAGLLALGAVLFVQFGLFALFWEQDTSRLSLVILGGLVVASAHAGYRSWLIDKECESARHLASSGTVQSGNDTSSIAQNYQHAVARALTNGRNSADLVNLGTDLQQQVRAGHASGWFVADLMIKLGLLGTVIGFIFMLNSVAQMETTDLNAAKLMLTQMSGGMRIALFTTLAGLSSGLILGVQYQLLDRAADKLFGLIVAAVDTQDFRGSDTTPDANP